MPLVQPLPIWDVFLKTSKTFPKHLRAKVASLDRRHDAYVDLALYSRSPALREFAWQKMYRAMAQKYRLDKTWRERDDLNYLDKK